MKLAFSLLLLFYTGSSMSCSLNRPLISLSGPITMLLEELGLLTDKNLKGISLFHPVNNFNGKKYGGGIFLGEKFFQEIGNSIIFYDQSRELNKLFSKKTTMSCLKINFSTVSTKNLNLNFFEKSLITLYYKK